MHCLHGFLENLDRNHSQKSLGQTDSELAGEYEYRVEMEKSPCPLKFDKA